MKTGQRNILTKERQAKLSTGGGPEQKLPELDPDIALIAPHLLETAPTQFSCDYSEAEIHNKRQLIRNNSEIIFDIGKEAEQQEIETNTTEDYTIEVSDEEDRFQMAKRSINDINLMKTKKQCVFNTQTHEIQKISAALSQEPFALNVNSMETKKQDAAFLNTQTCEMQEKSNASPSEETFASISKSSMIQKRKAKSKDIYDVKTQSVEINSVEQELKIQRLKQIMEQEKELSEIKLKRENNLLAHEFCVQELTVEHIKQLHKFKLLEAQAKYELSELLLNKEK